MTQKYGVYNTRYIHKENINLTAGLMGVVLWAALNKIPRWANVIL